jgi:hypothetical protein
MQFCEDRVFVGQNTAFVHNYFVTFAFVEITYELLQLYSVDRSAGTTYLALLRVF